MKQKYVSLNPLPPTLRLRDSTIKNPVLQLQKNDPLPPEAVSLLQLGPKFALSPKDIPTMDIITEVEKCCLQLENKGKDKEAETLRHEVTHTLLNAPKPKSNLTFQQRKGLTYLKSKKDISIAPYDKGVGFVVMEKEELVKKSEAEFKNVMLDTPDTTSSFEGKIQRTLRQLHREGKIDNETYK